MHNSLDTVGCVFLQVYHVTVMPCFDKKLEAARPELLSDGILWVLAYIHWLLDRIYLMLKHHCHRRDTDCVLTTIEVQEMIERDAAAAAAGVGCNAVQL